MRKRSLHIYRTRNSTDYLLFPFLGYHTREHPDTMNLRLFCGK